MKTTAPTIKNDDQDHSILADDFGTMPKPQTRDVTFWAVDVKIISFPIFVCNFKTYLSFQRSFIHICNISQVHILSSKYETMQKIHSPHC